jgi:hypothetical protein
MSMGNSGPPSSQAPYDGNKRFIGPNLQSVKRENDPAQPSSELRPCGSNVVMESDRDTDPASYNNGEWLDSPYFVEGSAGSGTGDVYGFIHNEFHGELFNPSTNCPGLGLNDCWLSSITLATAQFSQQPSIVNKVGAVYPDQAELVATVPYQYDPPTSAGQSTPPHPDGTGGTEATKWGRHGYIAPTNVLRATLPGQPEAYYMMAQVKARGAQKAGVCVIRTQDLSDADAWRAWGGDPPGWNVDLVNPYPTAPVTPANHVCTPVSTEELTALVPRSLYWDRHLNKFVVIGGFSGSPTVYALSDDLVNWSEMQELFDDGPDTLGTCDEQAGYPTTLDPSDPASAGQSGPADEPTVTPNFDHPGRRPQLIFNRPRDHLFDGEVPNNQSNDVPCDSGAPDFNVDLARVPIRLETRRAILDGGISGTDDSYDSTNAGGSGSPSSFIGGTGGDYENEGTVRYAAATNNIVDASSPKWAYGTLNLQGGALDDVDTNQAFSNKNGFWYSSAFFLPKDASNCANDFICENSTVDIMRWESTGSGATFFSGIRLKNGTNQFHLVRGSSTAGTVSTDIGTGFDLPTGRTFWLEVHQRLSNTNGTALSEVYVDGRLVMSSTTANRGAETSGSNPTHVTDSSSVSKVKYGFVSNSSPVGTNSFMALDSSSVTGGQLGALGAPATPAGMRALAPFSQQMTGVLANAAVGDAQHPAPTGYRWYRRNAGDAIWQLRAESATPSFADIGVSCGTAYEYRVTSYWQASPTTPEIDKKESVPSARVIAETTAC